MTPDITSITATFDDILKYDIEKHLIRTERFGIEFSFLQIKPELIQLFAAIQKLKQINLEAIPSGFIQAIKASVTQLGQVITQIAQYSPQGPNDTRHTFIAEFQEKNRQFLKSFIDILFYEQYIINPTKNDGASNAQALTEYFDNSKKAAQEQLDKIKNESQIHLDRIKNESQQQFDNVKETLAILTNKAKDLGVTKYTEVFRKQSRIYSLNSIIWLMSIVLFLVAILGASIYILNTPIVRGENNDDMLLIINVIQGSMAKVLIASTLFFGLAASLKNFRAYRHNEILNKHRQNALETFEAFSNSAADTQTKSAVLLEATHSIFGHQITGFSTTDKDSEVPSKIIEVLKPNTANSQ